MVPELKASVTNGISSASFLVPTASASSTVGAVLGRTCATQTSAPSSRRTHIRKSAKDRAASSCHSPTTACRWSTALPGSMVCSASRSPRVDIGHYSLADHRDEVTGLDDIANGHTHLADRACHFRQHGDFHLHRLQQHHGVALADLVALVNHDLEHTGHDLGANILGHLHPFRLLHAALSNHNACGSELSQRHETLVSEYNQMEEPMAKRGRKKRDRKHSKANHGKRPNS